MGKITKIAIMISFLLGGIVGAFVGIMLIKYLVKKQTGKELEDFLPSDDEEIEEKEDK